MPKIFHRKVLDAALKSDLLHALVNPMHEVPALSEQEVCDMTVDAKPGSMVFRPGTGVAVASYPLADGSDELVTIEVGGLALDSALFIKYRMDGGKAIIDVTKRARRGGWLQDMTEKHSLRLVGRESYCRNGVLVLEETYGNGLPPLLGGVDICMSYSKS
ncbi:MAG: hypothetical protein ABIA12_02630 [Candidatus Aenigmatarchaeota archaeon]